MSDRDNNHAEARVPGAEAVAHLLEPDPKKLRSSDPDLKIIVRENVGGITVEEEYPVYAQVFAQYSRFVDASLSVNMREKKTREITFHDVSPGTYEQAIKYLENPLAPLEMKPDDVFKVVEFYDKYEFVGGMKICDRILADFMEKFGSPSDEIVNEDTFDLLVRITATANNFNLTTATNLGIRFFTYVFGHIIYKFSVDHIRQLQPFLIRHKATALKEWLNITQEEMESILFPRLYVDSQTKFFDRQVIKAIKISGTRSAPAIGSNVDGIYMKNEVLGFYTQESGDIPWTGRPACKRVKQRVEPESQRKNWVIVAKFFGGNQEEIVLWESPYSSDRLFPPKGPWVAVHESARAISEPVIRVKSTPH